ncbi:MAG: LacI family DNA-binding transcriptional regulator [Pseudomonadota bacterium]
MQPEKTRKRRAFSAPKIDDVAEIAGVSTATVSRCLNTPDVVSPDTRERVMAAVTQLGYEPNFGARVMAAKRSNTIGAIIPTMENAIFARCLQAFQEELDRNDYTLLVASSSYKTDMEKQQLRTLLARGADAMLLIGFARDEEIYEMLEERQVPTVVAWSYRAGSRVASVGFDNKIAMREFADLVFKQGHRKIGVISAPTADNDRASERVAGIMESAAANGVDPSAIEIVETKYSIDNGARAAHAFLTSKVPPSALICGNDVLAIGALKAARELQLRVPEDLSITGFDDIELAQIADPGLTTVHVPHREMGRRAAKLLISLVENPRHLPSEQLATRIVKRGTLGPAPHSS